MKCLWWGTQSCFSVPVGKLAVPTKDKYTFLQWSNSISVYFRREISVHAHQKTWTAMFITALLEIVKKWKQLRHLWVAEQISNLCCSFTMRRYSTEKGHTRLYAPHECITRTQQCWGEGSQIQKNTHRLLWMSSWFYLSEDSTLISGDRGQNSDYLSGRDTGWEGTQESLQGAGHKYSVSWSGWWLPVCIQI